MDKSANCTNNFEEMTSVTRHIFEMADRSEIIADIEFQWYVKFTLDGRIIEQNEQELDNCFGYSYEFMQNEIQSGKYVEVHREMYCPNADSVTLYHYLDINFDYYDKLF